MEPEPLPPTVKQEVKAEVKKELRKSDFSWIRRDWLVVGALFFMLAILATVTTVAARQARDASAKAAVAAQEAKDSFENTNLLADCFTPGTECAKFIEAGDKREQEYFAKLVTDASLCTILTSRRLMGSTDLVGIEQVYKACVAERTPPPPTQSTPGG